MYAWLNAYETEKPFCFSRHATIGCGGVANVGVFPKTVEELVGIVARLQEENVPYCVVGRLSNTLPPDGQTDTVIVSTIRMKGIEDGFFSAGINGAELLAYCKAHGLHGVEFLQGIPCTLGGVLYMNAGVNGAHIADVVERVRVLRDGRIVELPVSACGYGYKTSVFMRNQDCILGATLRLEKATEGMIFQTIEQYKNRRAHLPRGKSMGCVFKNPDTISAGELIEKTGLKGYRIGGAVVAEEHANFIINDKHATSMQVKCLIDVVKSAVYAQYKIHLEEEIQYVR